MINAKLDNNRLVLINCSHEHGATIKESVNSAVKFKNNLHIPATAYSIKQLASVLKQLNEKLEPKQEQLQQLYSQYNTIANAELIKSDITVPQPVIRKTGGWLHQLQAYQFAMQVKTAMFDMGVGTGKTKTAIDVIQNSTNVRRVLVVMPKYILEDVGAWIKQFDIHCNIDYEILSLSKGSTKTKTELLDKTLRRLETSNMLLVVLINYETLWREPLATYLLKSSFRDVIVFDESHRIKGHNSNTSNYSAKLALQFEKRLCLTGTMMANSPLDVFGQFRALDIGVFGSSWIRFRDRYADVFMNDNIPIIKGFVNQEELGKKIGQLTFHAPSTILNLPEPLNHRRYFELEKNERKLYDELERSFGLELQQGVISVTNQLVMRLRLQQLTGGCLPLESDETGETTLTRLSYSKARLLEEVLNDLPSTERVVVFYKFKADADAIQTVATLTKRIYGEISGRAYDKAKWSNNKINLLAVNVSSGEGLDLHEANYGVFYSVDTLQHFIQCGGRIQRPPRTGTAHFIHLIANNTVDDVIYAALVRNESIVEAVRKHFIK